MENNCVHGLLEQIWRTGYRKTTAHCRSGGASSRGRGCPWPWHTGTTVRVQITCTPPPAPPMGPPHHHPTYLHGRGQAAPLQMGPPHRYPTYLHGRGQAAPLQRHLFFVLTPSCCGASPDTALAGILDFFSIFLIFIYCVWLHLVSVAPTRSSIFSVACAI